MHESHEPRHEHEDSYERDGGVANDAERLLHCVLQWPCLENYETAGRLDLRRYEILARVVRRRLFCYVLLQEREHRAPRTVNPA